MCAGNVTRRGKSVQCCTCSKLVHLRCSHFSLSKFRTLDSSHSWSCPPTVSPLETLLLPSRTLPTCILPLYKLALCLLMLHFRPTLVFKLLIPRRPILYLLPPPPFHHSLLLAVLLRLLPPLPPDSFMVLQWIAGGLPARTTKLLYFFSSHPVDRICIQESKLNSSSSFRNPGLPALRNDRTTPGLAFSLVMPCMLAAVSSFSSGRGYPYLNFYLFSFFA